MSHDDRPIVLGMWYWVAFVLVVALLYWAFDCNGIAGCTINHSQ